ncbi:MAG: hypothetical protein FWF21_12355 [Micrococcales bacterium]|nr:hypothetical protein [Micrococcales bacterium]
MPFPGATVYLEKPEREQVSHPYTPEGATDEEREQNRLAWIAAGRTQKLLDLLPASPDKTGCFRAPTEQLGDAEFVILDALERGNAVVENTATGGFVPDVKVRYTGSRAGPTSGIGYISVSLPDTEEPFLSVQWWIS